MYIRFLATILVLIICAAPAPAPAQVVVFEEDFDDADAPAGWALDDGWSISTMTPSSGSGVNSLQHRGNAASSATMPVISLSGAMSASLSYLIRRTGSYAADNLIVTASGDGGATFPDTLLGVGKAVPTVDSKWEMVTAPIPSNLLGLTAVVIRFEGQGLYTAGATSRIDDILLSAAVPLEIAPHALSFVARVGEARTKSISVTNRTSEFLNVGAPVLTGADFTIEPSSGVSLAAGASQRYDITFTAASRGAVDGLVRLDYGTGVAEVALSGAGSGGVLGFAADSSATLEEESGFGVPLQLGFSAPRGLQGLQFRIAWPGEVLSLAGLQRGAAVADESAWTISYETGAGYADVVLLGDGGASIDGGMYDELLSLLFDVDSVETTATVHLNVESVIGALSDPHGSDADITPPAAGHVVTIDPRVVFFDASSTEVDVGASAAGQISTATVSVSNLGGNTDMVVREVALSNPLFSITPDSARIPPDASAEFTITFAPTLTSFGRQSADVTFMHNGDTSADVIAVTGMGLGGRGDADGDGVVDALDIIHVIDFVLNRLTPEAAQQAAADLFPFDDGDGELDVRDLTVLAQGIVRGMWPDDIQLPVEEPAAVGGEPGGVRLSADPLMIEMAHETPIRAFQIVLPASADARIDMGASNLVPATGTPPGGGLSAGGDDGSEAATVAFGVRSAAAPGNPGSTAAATHELRILVYRPDGGLIAPGTIHLATSGVTGRPRYVAVIGEGRDRLRVDDSVWTGTEDALPSTVLPKKPYPNPFRAGVDLLRIPVGSGARSVVVYDLLGRVVRRLAPSGAELEWDGADASGRRLGAGLYFVRVGGGQDARTHIVQALP